jgi:hypothetical protein
MDTNTRRTARHQSAYSLIVLAATSLVAACSSDSISASRDHAVTRPSSTRQSDRAPDLSACSNLTVTDGVVAFHAFATGVQIYKWTGSSWSFVAPSAALYADPDGNGMVGIHYVGPTWESTSGSKVVGAVAERCTPNATAIPWLKLQAVSSDGPGIFSRVTYIQRVNTVGGTAPSAPGSVAGEIANVPYTAEYYFYRAP